MQGHHVLGHFRVILDEQVSDRRCPVRVQRHPEGIAVLWCRGHQGRNYLRAGQASVLTGSDGSIDEPVEALVDGCR